MSVMFPVCTAPGPHSSLSEEFLHSIILRPKKPLGSLNLVNPLLSIKKRGRMNVLPDYNLWQINTKPLATLNFRNRKIPRFDRNNPIMPWGQKISFKKRGLVLHHHRILKEN